jgi:hypothetical protein
MPTFNTTDPNPGYVYDSSNDTWYPLLGIAPASEVNRWTKTAAGAETSLSGNDDNAVSLSYTAGTEQVYLNGVLLARGSDYTATNGTTITGLTALAANDIAEVITFNPSNIITTDAVLSTDFAAKGDLISASAASTPIRLPVGTTGYVLKANSATTSGLEWAAAPADIEGVTAGTGISGGGTSGTVTITNSMATAIDAKGDLVAGTGADAFARLAVGTNGQVLTAASGEATGLSWATPATGTTYVGCAAYRDTNLSVTKNTNTLLTLPSEQYDTDGFHSTSSNTGRFTVPAGKAGKYLLTCFVSYSTSITEQAWLMLYINGAAATSAGLSLGRFQEFGGSANTDAIAGSVTYTYSVGDYAEVYVFHNGTNTPINLDAARVTFDYLGA